MATETPNIKLILHEGSDRIAVGALNSNTTKLDQEILALKVLTSSRTTQALNPISGADIRVASVGKVCVCQGYGSSANIATLNTYFKVGTLPEGYRPWRDIYFVYSAIAGDLNQQSARIRMDGSVEIYSSRALSSWAFNVTFITP